MPSFDISSDIDWQNLDDAVNQANKEIGTRYDFKGIKTELKVDKKEKTVTIWCSESGKMDALKEIFENRLVKRGISLLALDYQALEQAFGQSVRQKIIVQAGISKEKGKEIIAALKETKLKAQAQIQDEKVRVTSKSRDDLQEAIAFLRGKMDSIKVPMQFGNFRE